MEQLQPGQMLGPYQIINQIDEGGMATVYKAYQPSMDRNVAIKVLPRKLAESSEFTQRFQQEAHIIAKLEHPHILPVFDYGESDGITYLVMRYLDAGTLKDKMVKHRPLPLDEIDRIFTQLADALSYAHSFGIVHRDLKPANALVDTQGNLFLTDFGIAKLLESASPKLTETNAVMGTPAYISPEQAQSVKIDQRSDIYSLGIILYEMVTGRVPFVAETPLAVILKHVSDPLPPPTTINQNIPEAIESVLLKALAKNPDDRFANVSDFLSAWKSALKNLSDGTKVARPAPETIVEPVTYEETSLDQPQGTPVTNTRQATSAPTPSSRRGSWAGWVVGCLIGACALITIGGGAFFLFNRNNAASTPPTQTLLPTHTAGPVQPTNTPPPTEAVIIPPSGETLLEDDFTDDSIWGILTDTTAIIGYDNNALRMQIFEQNWIVWSTPNFEVYENIHVEVTAINNDGEPTTAFGIMCNQQEADSSYYYAVMTPGGEYAIAVTSDEAQDVFLTNDNRWGASNLIRQNAPSYRIGMDCGYGTITLYVDGQLIDSVSDDTYSSGIVGLITWSGEEISSADVSYDDFVVTSLE
ncbi:MAG: protein kinase [Anaerolineales bacterium]|nr:protein kinase [Anaerolineales bacterium]